MAKFQAIPMQGRRMKQYDLSSSESYNVGAAVLLDGSQEITEAGADPAEILGFAAFAAGDEIESDTAIVAVAHEGATFLMEGDSDPTSSDINQDYGIASDGDGDWHVDTTDTSNTVVHVEDVDLDRNLFEVSVLSGSRQSEG